MILWQVLTLRLALITIVSALNNKVQRQTCQPLLLANVVWKRFRAVISGLPVGSICRVWTQMKRNQHERAQLYVGRSVHIAPVIKQHMIWKIGNEDLWKTDGKFQLWKGGQRSMVIPVFEGSLFAVSFRRIFLPCSTLITLRWFRFAQIHNSTMIIHSGDAVNQSGNYLQSMYNSNNFLVEI